MEIWDVLDKEGRAAGRTVTRGFPLPEGDYHLVIDVWIRNIRGEYLISRRSPDKYPDPGLWEPTCGSAIAGESSLSAALREVREELGIALEPKLGQCIHRVVLPPNSIIDVWLFTVEAIDIINVVLQPGETDDAMWAGAEYIRQLADDGKFLPDIRVYYLKALLDGTLEKHKICG